MFFFFLAVN